MMPARVDVAVIGGGIAGLCVADRLRRESPDVVVRVYEASGRAGGKLLTERIETNDGRFIIETGPDAWLAQKPWASELVADLGLTDQVIPIARLGRPVAILKRGRLVDLPEGVSLIAPGKARPFLRSRLLSPRGKLRVAADLVIRARRDDADESLGAFVERRLGREALDWIAEPIAAGIYNADPDRLSLLATFPQLRKLERENGSVIKGLRRGAKARQSPHSRHNGRGGGGEGYRSAEGYRSWYSRWFDRGRPGLKARAEENKPTEGAEPVEAEGNLPALAGFSRLQTLARVFRPGPTDDRLGRIAIIRRYARRRPGMNSGSQRRMSAEADSSGSLGEAFTVSPGFQPGATLGEPSRASRTIVVKTAGPHPALSHKWERVMSDLRASGRLPSAPTNRPPTFLTLRDGMGTLVDAMASRMSDAVETGAAVIGIIAESTGGYRLTFADRTDVRADHVVLTIPAAVAAELLAEVVPDAAARLRELRAVHAGTITLAYRTADIPRSLPGYGLVIPAREGRPINAITVASRKFADRAPEGWSLLRVFFGGYRSPETMRLDDDDLLDVVTAELRDLLDITAPPTFHRIHRWPAGSPQYDVGHLDRIAAIEAALPAGISVTGSPYRGVGIPDVIREAWTSSWSMVDGRWNERSRALLPVRPSPFANVLRPSTNYHQPIDRRTP